MFSEESKIQIITNKFILYVGKLENKSEYIPIFTHSSRHGINHKMGFELCAQSSRHGIKIKILVSEILCRTLWLHLYHIDDVSQAEPVV